VTGRRLTHDLRKIAADVVATADALEHGAHVDPRAIKSQIERLTLALIDMVRLERPRNGAEAPKADLDLFGLRTRLEDGDV
jgi:hypothetical protein